MAGVTAGLHLLYIPDRSEQLRCVWGPVARLSAYKGGRRKGCAWALALAPLCGGADNVEALCLWPDVIIMTSVFDWSRIYGCDWAVAPPIVTGPCIQIFYENRVSVRSLPLSAL